MNADALKETLGQRIVQAARLAVAMHLADSLLSPSTDDREQQQHQQQIRVGGADHRDRFTDEALPPLPTDDRRRFCRRRSSPSADGGAA